MKAELLSETIIAYYGLNIPLLVTGPPGGGKTSIVKQTVRKMRKPSITVHMPTALVEDFGVPDIVSTAIARENDEYEDTSFGYRLPAWFPAAGGPLDNGRGGVLIFDDRNQADHSLQKVQANILQDRSLHGHKMASGWYPISTGNRQSDRAGANRILGHLADRETEIELESDLDTSTRWMLDHDGAAEVVAYLRYRPGMLHNYDPQADKSPTPRGWHERVSPVLGNVSKDAEYECFKGAVGDGAAAEFTGFLHIWRDLEDPDMIIANPKGARVPTDAATLYALSGALSTRASTDNFAAIITFAKRLPSEFTVLMLSMSVRTNPDVSETSAYIAWLGEASTHALLF